MLEGRPSADDGTLKGRPSAADGILKGRPTADDGILKGRPTADDGTLEGSQRASYPENIQIFLMYANVVVLAIFRQKKYFGASIWSLY